MKPVSPIRKRKSFRGSWFEGMKAEMELTEMTEEEYACFYSSSLHHHVSELMEQENLSQETAEAEAKKELAEMLPEGRNTADNCLMSIKEGSRIIGYIWTMYECCDGIKQAFVCDFYIEEADRRKGFGTQALLQAENLAREQSCRESVLFVANGNGAAEALYRKSGYGVREPHSYGKYMVKTL